MTGCAPGLSCDSCGHCGPLISYGTRRAPGMCCPEPSCDYPREPTDHYCEVCGKDCRTCTYGSAIAAFLKNGIPTFCWTCPVLDECFNDGNEGGLAPPDLVRANCAELMGVRQE